MTISIDLKPILGMPKTYLTSLTSSGSGTLSVINNSNFVVNDFIIIGNIGEEVSEVRKISSVTGSNGIVLSSNLSFDHPSSTLIQKIYFDQLIVEKSTNGTVYSPLVTYTIAGDQSFFETNDTTGSNTTYYRSRFYNSVTLAYSEFSNAYTNAVPSVIDLIASDVIRRMKAEGDPLITVNDIIQAIADVDMNIYLEMSQVNKNIGRMSQTIAMTAGQQEYGLASDVMKITQIRIRYSSSDMYKETLSVDPNFGDGTGDYTGDGLVYLYRNSSDGLLYLGLKQIPSTGTTGSIQYYYMKQPTRINSLTDTLNIPNALSYLHIIKLGVMEILYRDYKDRPDLADRVGQKYMMGLMDIKQMTSDIDDSERAYEMAGDTARLFNSFYGQ